MTSPIPSPRVIAACALLFAPPALAQGTAAQRAACGSDAFRLCASHIPNVGAIGACLRRERASLSDACRATVDAADVPRMAAAEPPARLQGARTNAVRYRTVRTRDGRRVVRATVVRQRGERYAARGFGGLPFGLGGNRRQMREARYWMGQLGAYAPMVMGMIGGGGAGGFDLGAIREMRIGDVMDMMQ
jgi:hypothetical protein